MKKVIETAKDNLSGIKDTISGYLKTDVVEKMNEYGLDKLNEAWNQIDGATEILKQTGYILTGINVNLGIPPTITLSLDQDENIDDDAEERLLEENKDKTFLYPILVALFKANAFQKSMKTKKYKFSGIHVGLTLPPSIVLRFNTF